MESRVPRDSQDMESKQADSEASVPSIVEKFVIRLPHGLRDQIKEISELNRRSMNSEIIMVLEQYIQDQGQIEHPDLDLANIKPVEETQTELNRKLEALTPDKKNALLSLLT